MRIITNRQLILALLLSGFFSFQLFSQRTNSGNIKNLTIQSSAWKEGGIYEGYTPSLERTKYRSRISKTFQNPDGTFTAVFGGIQHYRDEYGQWQEINYDITDNNSAKYAEYLYCNTTAEIKSYFPESPGDKGVIMKYDDTELSWWNEPKMELRNDNGSVYYTSHAKSVAEPVRNTLKYKEAYPGIDEEFVILENGIGIENNIIINYPGSFLNNEHKNAQLRFSQFIPLENGWQVSDGENIRTTDFSSEIFVIKPSRNNRSIYFNPVVIFDSKTDKREAIQLINKPKNESISSELQSLLDNNIIKTDYHIHFVDGGIEVSFSLPQNWLLEEGRNFPVTIDPTATIGSITNNYNLLWNARYIDSRLQALFFSSDLTGAGMGNGDVISSLELYAGTVECPGSHTGLAIRMKNTTATTTTSFDNSGYTNVYSGTQNISATGFYNHTFSPNYTFNSSNNLMIDFTMNRTSDLCALSDLHNYWGTYDSFANRSVYGIWTVNIGNPQTQTVGTSWTFLPYIRLTYLGGITSNDNCSNATPIAVGTKCYNTVHTTAGASASGEPNGACGDNAVKDVWFKTVVPSSGSLIISTSTYSIPFDGCMALYYGPCSNLTEIGCLDDVSGTPVVEMPTIYKTGMDPGAILYIRFWDKDEIGTNFNLCMYDPTISAGIDVDPAQNNANTLVQDVLITGCLEALNVTHTGHANSISYFDQGQVVGFNDGILLTSGNTIIAEGPNNLPNAGTFDGTGGDADLTTLSGNTTFNASVLEFDFIPSSDTVTFRYVFGSEEYPEYVCSQFNDVFGFFLSGPGISGPFSNSAINIAQVPNDISGTINPPESYYNTPVAINSINIGEAGAFGADATCDGLYPNWRDYVHYYVRNGDGTTPADNPHTQYDGYTVPLVARAVVQACETYHIKLAVADASDEQLDSGVFLEANSFFSPDPPDMSFVTATGDMSEVYEGCSTFITITRANTQDIVNPEIVSLDLSGSTATPGTDYPAIPDPIIIPPGDTSVVIDITPINDGSAEPDETIIINYYEGCPCTSTPIQEVITIKDFVGINGGIDNIDPIFCEGSSPLELTTSVAGQGAYTYLWNTGATSSGIFVSPTVNTIYSVDIIDSCGNFITDQVTVTFIPYPPTTFSHSATTCSYYNAVTFTPNAGASDYVWSFPGGTPSSSTDQTPTINFPPGGTYTVELTSATTPDGCTSLAPTQHTFTIPSEVNGNINGTNCLCNSDNTGAADLTPSGGTPPYTFIWNPGSFATTEDVSGLAAGVYTVVISDNLGCVSPSPPMVSINEPSAIGTNPPTITDPLCNGDTNGSVTANPTGGTPNYSYTWNTNPPQTTNPATDLADGTYQVTITDANGCTYETSYTVTAPDIISLATNSTDAMCNQATGSATVLPTGGVGSFTYQWSTGGTGPSITSVTAGTYNVTVTDGNGCTETTSVIVNDEGAPAGVISDTTMVSCFGLSDGSATVSASGGTPPYTYLWPATGCTDATATGLVGGMTYTVYVTDSLGCQSSTQVTITQPSQIVDTLTGTDVPCNDGSSYGTANLIVSGGIPPYSYLWSNGETVQNPDNLISGTYSVTITDNNGCTKTDNVTINVPPVLVASVTTDSVSCYGGDDGAASVSASGGTPGQTVLYEYDIGNGLQQNVNFSNLSTGSYTVTVYDDNGCTITEVFSIPEPAPIDITLLFITDANCGSNDGSAAVSASGGTPPFSYVWYPSSQANDTAYSLAGGTYSVTVTDDNGCVQVMEDITVGDTPAGTAVIDSVEHVDCNGNSTGSATVAMTGNGTPPYEYIWSNFQTDATIENLPALWYYVTITDDNGCSSTTGILITQPGVLVAIIPGENITAVECYGDATGSLEVDVSGGTTTYTYLWPSGGTGQSEQDLYAGPYTVTVTDNNGCTTTASAEVTQPETALIIDVLNIDTVCSGESDGYARVSAHGGTEGGGYSYLWPDNSTADDHYNLSPGDYTITVTDANECTAVRTINIFPAPEISYSWDTISTTCSGAENGKITCVANVVNPPYSYVWSNLETSTHLDSLAAGWYYITITDGSNCTVTTSFEVYNSTAPCLVIPNVITPNDDGYNDTWNIEYLRLYNNVTIQVFNRWGEIVFEYEGDGAVYENDETKRWDGRSSANGKPLPLGAYIFVIVFNNTGIQPEQGIVTIVRKGE